MIRVHVYGAENLAATLDAAAPRMDRLGAQARTAAAITLAAAHGLAPRRTGQLAASLGVTAWSRNTFAVTSSRVYAGVVHWGWPARSIPANPFVTEAAQSTEPAWLRRYATHVEATLDTVKGL